MRALFLNHWANESSKNSIQMQEPMLQDGLIIQRQDEFGEGWCFYAINAIGRGRSLCYRDFDIDKPCIFFSETSENALCLRIEVSNNSFYENEEPSYSFLLWSQSHCEVFCSDGKTLEENYIKGRYAIVDILFRPEELVYLAHIPAVGELLKKVQYQFFEIESGKTPNLDKQTNELIQVLIDKLDGISPSVNLFSYVCDCLLVLCLGENVELVQNQKYADFYQNGFPFRNEYKPNGSEREILLELEDESRMTLMDMFMPLYNEMQEVKNKWNLENQLSNQLNDISTKIWSPVREQIADTYMNFAHFLAKIFDRERGLERSKIKEFIVLSCEHAFQYRDPRLTEQEFYKNWAGESYIWRPLLLDAAYQLFFGILSFDFSKLSEGLDEKFRGPIRTIDDSSLVFRRATKSQQSFEVIQIYERLMLFFCESLLINEERGILGSEIVRELDMAFQHNDYMKLLLVEVITFVDSPGFLESKTKQELMYLITAIRLELELYQLLLFDMEESPVYFELQLVHQLGDNLESYKEHMSHMATNEEGIAGRLNQIIYDLNHEYSLGYVMELAAHLLRVNDKGNSL